MATDDHDDVVKSNVDRIAGFAAIRQISELSREINENESKDKKWTKKAIITLTGLALLVAFVALAEPSLVADIFRLTSGIIK